MNIDRVFYVYEEEQTSILVGLGAGKAVPLYRFSTLPGIVITLQVFNVLDECDCVLLSRLITLWL
jgi:hypothetical protein